MGLALILTSPQNENKKQELNLLKIISRIWTQDQWELYLKQTEIPAPKEEMYVGTTKNLEDYASRKSQAGIVPAPSVEDIIEFGKSTRKKGE